MAEQFATVQLPKTVHGKHSTLHTKCSSYVSAAFLRTFSVVWLNKNRMCWQILVNSPAPNFMKICSAALDKPRHTSPSLCSIKLRRMWQPGAVLYIPRFDNDLSISSGIPNAREAAFYKTAHAQTRHTAVNLDHQVLTLGRSVGSRR